MSGTGARLRYRLFGTTCHRSVPPPPPLFSPPPPPPPPTTVYSQSPAHPTSGPRPHDLPLPPRPSLFFLFPLPPPYSPSPPPPLSLFLSPFSLSSTNYYDAVRFGCLKSKKCVLYAVFANTLPFLGFASSLLPHLSRSSSSAWVWYAFRRRLCSLLGASLRGKADLPRCEPSGGMCFICRVELH